MKNVPKIRFQGYTEEWEEKKLGECFSERTERDSKGELISVTINQGIKRFSELNRHDNSSEDKSNYKKVKIGDIAYNSMRMWQGASGYSEYDGIVSPAYTVITPKGSSDGKFYAYMFKKNELIHLFELNSQGITSDTWNLKFPKFKEIEVHTSNSADEQLAVSKMFSSLDARITAEEQKLQKLQHIKKALLQKMFPQGKSKVPEIRFQGYRAEWEEKKLSEVAGDFQYGINAPAKKYDGLHKYLRITDIDDDSHEFNHAALTSPDCSISILNNYILDEKNIVFARTGASVGKTYRYSKDDGDVFFAGFLIRCSVNDDNDTDFVFQNTLTKKYRKYISITSQRSGQPGINAEEYQEFQMVVPDFNEQTAIGKLLSSLDKQINLQQQMVEKLQILKKAFLKDMFVN